MNKNNKIKKPSKEESSSNESSNGEDISINDSIENLGLDKIDNPRQREILLIAKYKMMSNKIKAKDQLIKNLKETLESDDQIKHSMQNKIEQLKETIENIKENKLIKEPEEGKGIYHNLDDENEEASKIIPHREEISQKELNTHVYEKKRNDYEYNTGISTIAQIHQNVLYNINNKTILGKLRHKWHNIISFFTPFKADLKYFQFKYDRNVFTFFDLIRFMFLLSIVVFITFTYFLVVNGIDNEYTNDNIYCRYYIPCMLFYSRISFSLASTYSITYATMTFVVFYFSVIKFISFSNLKQNSEIYKKEEKKLSQIFFNCWSWSIKSKKKYLESKKNLREYLKSANKELENKNTFTFNKIILRSVSFLFSLSLLLIYAGFILATYILRNYLRDNQTNKTTNNTSDILCELIPPLLIAFFNIIFPSIFILFTYLEKWEYKSTETIQRTIRYFICKIFGLGVIYFLNIYFVLLQNPLSKILPFLTDAFFNIFNNICPGNYKINSNYSLINAGGYTSISKQLYSKCSQDDTVINILFIFLAEFIMIKVFELIIYFIQFTFSSNRRAGYTYKYKYKVEEAGVDILSYNIQLYAIIPFFPYIVVLTPFFLLIEYYYQKFKMLFLRSKPINPLNNQKNGSLIMSFFKLTIVIIVVFNSLFFISRIPRNNMVECFNNSIDGNVAFIDSRICGPFVSNVSVSDIFIENINSISFFGFLYSVFSNAEPLILLLILIICLLLFRRNNSEMIKLYNREKENEYLKNSDIWQTKLDALKIETKKNN